MNAPDGTPTVRQTHDVGTVSAAEEVLAGHSKKGRLGRLLPFMGPAFIASIAYVDPGNFATNISAGAKYGYLLLWVILYSNLMAMLIQSLSAKLGIASGLNLAEQCRENFRRPVVIALWLLAELVAIATDLAEFLGAAVGFNLLFGIPLLPAGILTAITTFVILGLERYGFRRLEAVITGFLGVIAGCFLLQVVMGTPDWPEVAYHSFIPGFSGPDTVLLAAGILGATVMPHVIYLHSALMQGRIVTRKPEQLRRLYRFEIIDVVVAMGVAGLVNMAMLITASAAFHATGLTQVGSLEDAYLTLEPLLGRAASTVFAIALLASGLSSSSVGTMAGQVIMQGFIRKHIHPAVRRLVTMLPALVVIAIGLDPTQTLVISQVVLSFGLPFAVIPLVYFTSRSNIMGVLVNRRATTVLASLVAGIIVALNLYLVAQVFTGGGG